MSFGTENLDYELLKVVATFYLVMVAVIVGLNYRLRGRQNQILKKQSSNGAFDEVEEVVEAEKKAGLRVCFTEGKATFSKIGTGTEAGEEL